MKLNEKALDDLALMVRGQHPFSHFPQRNSWNSLGYFFIKLGVDYKNSETDETQVKRLLTDMNNLPNDDQFMPSPAIVSLIELLLDKPGFKSRESVKIGISGETPRAGQSYVDACRSVNRLLETCDLIMKENRGKKLVVCRIENASSLKSE